MPGFSLYRSLLPCVSSDNLPGHVAPGPPQSSKLHLRFSFDPVMLCEAESTMMLL